MTVNSPSSIEGPARSSWFPWSHHKQHFHPALQAAHDDRTLGERVADNIASFGGSWPFIFIFLGLIIIWMVINSVLIQRVLSSRPFDPYPYIALNLVLSGLAGLQAPIIMMSQNRAAQRDEILAAHHYKETHQIDDLLESNTALTQQVHDLATKIHDLTEQIVGRTASPGSDS
ncbi:MAG: DUF1003 domain-containing protein [Actinomycetota bacterium]|nr:MAG: DUF1003 domain-containing protein [Actinomycetota bacterium]